MNEDNKLAPRENGTPTPLEILPPSSRLPVWELSPREPHLYDYLLVLRKHQWLILSFMLAVVTIVTIATFRMQPVYVATARIEIDRENSNILPFQGGDAYDYFMDLDNYIETQSKILTSETLALQTIRSLGLAGGSGLSSPGSSSGAIATGDLANQKRPPQLAQFLGSLSVKRVQNTRLLDVSFESTNPGLAAKIVNDHIQNFIQQNFRSRYEATSRASTWLADQLNELKVKVEDSENARLAYERQNQIWQLGDKQNITTERLEDLNKELTDAETDLVRKEALYKFAKAGNIDVVPQYGSDTVLQDLLRRRSDAESTYSDALNQYGPNFPKVQRIQGQIKEIDKLIAAQKKSILDQIASDYQASVERVNLLSQALDKQKAEASEMAERLVQYNILTREAAANKSMYDGLLTTLKQADKAVGLKSSNIRVVDPAMVPTTPARPAKTRNIALSILVGLVGGIGLALLREYLDNTVKTPDDVETLARLPSLAVVPFFAETNGNGRRSRLLSNPSGNGHEKRVELVAQHLPKSQTSEAFRALRTALLLSQAERPPQVILVTSALPREGKNTAAANLAVTLAQLGDRTILLYAD